MIETMRITLIGASGVGKTTLAERVATVLHLPLIPEVARSLCREKGVVRIGDIADQEAFKFEVLERQIELENALPAYVADRSTVDCWVLWQRWNICSAMTYDTERMYDQVKAQSRTYTHIIYVPPLIEAVEDGFRWTDGDYSKQLDRLVRMTLWELGLMERTLTISSITMEERVAEVERWIA
ncbi:MAG: ATP-binding protein [Candidatus Obscuribacterales bacterium]|nr:ATP-binding protein [Candidatus Obscuribacterales bacterium]